MSNSGRDFTSDQDLQDQLNLIELKVKIIKTLSLSAELFGEFGHILRNRQGELKDNKELNNLIGPIRANNLARQTQSITSADQAPSAALNTLIISVESMRRLFDSHIAKERSSGVNVIQSNTELDDSIADIERQVDEIKQMAEQLEPMRPATDSIKGHNDDHEYSYTDYVDDSSLLNIKQMWLTAVQAMWRLQFGAETCETLAGKGLLTAAELGHLAKQIQQIDSLEVFNSKTPESIAATLTDNIKLIGALAKRNLKALPADNELVQMLQDASEAIQNDVKMNAKKLKDREAKEDEIGRRLIGEPERVGIVSSVSLKANISSALQKNNIAAAVRAELLSDTFKKQFSKDQVSVISAVAGLLGKLDLFQLEILQNNIRAAQTDSKDKVRTAAVLQTIQQYYDELVITPAFKRTRDKIIETRSAASDYKFMKERIDIIKNLDATFEKINKSKFDDKYREYLHLTKINEKIEALALRSKPETSSRLQEKTKITTKESKTKESKTNTPSHISMGMKTFAHEIGKRVSPPSTTKTTPNSSPEHTPKSGKK